LENTNKSYFTLSIILITNLTLIYQGQMRKFNTIKKIRSKNLLFLVGNGVIPNIHH